MCLGIIPYVPAGDHLVGSARADGAAPDASQGECRETLVGVDRGKVLWAMQRPEAPPPTQLFKKFC